MVVAQGGGLEPRPRGRRGFVLAAVVLLALAAGPAEGRGRIEGQVVRADGSGVGGVAALLVGAGAPVLSDSAGRFALENVDAGSYTLTLVLGSNNLSLENVEVVDGETTDVRQVVDWAVVFAETLTVTAASRRIERVVDAPAAVTVITPEQIEREAATGQLPKLLESAPGVEITQSGLYDFKFNTRGLNTMANRRVAVLVDGRDPSYPLIGAQEWAAASFPLNDLAGAELVRGPSSALYGANAFNGVLNLVTKSPRDYQGGFARLTGGELSTLNADLGFYAELGGGWYFKGTGGYRQSDDFSLSRNETVEYSVPCLTVSTVDCLPLEAAPLPIDGNDIYALGLRVDKDLDAGHSLVLEAGTAQLEGPMTASAAGRFQSVDIDRPWARVGLAAPNWNLLAYYNDRSAETFNLSAAAPSFTESTRIALEFQARWSVAKDRGRIVAGLWAKSEDVDTANPQGIQTLIESAVDHDFEAVFAQFDYAVNEKVKLVVAGRLDDSSLYDTEFSPKASLVWSPKPAHTFRLGFNDAFLAGSYPEYFVRVPLAPPFGLEVFEDLFCAPVGVSCGFDQPVSFLAVGNGNLTVEENRTLEAGYRGILGERTYLTVDIFDTEIENFIRTGIPNVGTVLGRANPDYPAYAPPAGLPPEVALALVATLQAGPLGAFFPFLSNPVADEPVYAFITLANTGKLKNRGVELAIEHSLDDTWSLDFNYTWMDFDFDEQLPEAPLGFNSPESQGNLGVQYLDDRLAAALRVRWVDSFRFTEGVVNGIVESYEVVNLVASYQVSDRAEVGVNISNLLDEDHYEVFQGDLMGRLALAHLTYRW